MEKPSTGWLHDDSFLVNGDGVFFAIKYIGSIPMGMSMSQIAFDERTEITREAISQTCEAAGMFPPTRRDVSSLVQQAIPPQVRPTPMNLNVKLYISIKGLTIVHIESDQPVGMHIMPSISFATGGGNPEDAQVIGYVAKDEQNARNVYVFDCGGQAEDIIATMGQGFELRYKAFLKKGNPSAGAPPAQNAGGDLYGDASNYGDASPYGGDAAPQAYGGEGLYDTAAASSGDPGVYGGDALYDEAATGGDLYGGDAVYDEAAGMQEAAYDTAAGTGYLDTSPNA